MDASKVAVEKIANAALPTFHIVGDSTVKSGGTGAGLWGWGERITPFFDTNKINVVNHAIGGRSARTYFTEGRWQKVADTHQARRFCHHPVRPQRSGPHRRSGEERPRRRQRHRRRNRRGHQARRHEGTRPHLRLVYGEVRHRREGERRDGDSLSRRFRTSSAGKTGAILQTSPSGTRRSPRTHGALYFDLTLVITDAYKKVGAEKVATFFADKGTHTTDSGAQFNAACVIAGLKSLPNDPLEKFFSEKGKAIEPYQAASQTISTNAPAPPIKP